jgi:pyrimidine operon attenuation protein/uracil phosphoribosyltransferase
MEEKRVILNENEISRMLTRMAYEILEKISAPKNLAIVGIYTRGAFLAKRLKKIMDEIAGFDFPIGEIDINLYRDDWTRISAQPEVKESKIYFSVDDKEIILVDDVIFTGRTTRAAIDALLDFGRPSRIMFAALIDRDHRELPIQPDVTGKFIETEKNERVNVFVKESDGKDLVSITGEN